MKQRGRKSKASLALAGKPHLVAISPPPDVPQPPPHLGEPERAIWAYIVADWSGSRASFAVLTAGLEAHQRARECREIIGEEGMVVTGRDNQPRAHPLINAERDARRAFAQTFRQLGIKI